MLIFHLKLLLMKDRLLEKLNNTLDWFVTTGPDLLVGVSLLVIFYLLGVYSRKLIHRHARRKPERGVILGFLGNVLMAAFVIIGLIFMLNELNLNKLMAGLLAGAGFISIIVGIAFKDIGENFLSGILLAFSRPFAIGDLLQVESTTGRVLQLNLRNTHLRTVEGRDVFVPNSWLVNRMLVNYTRDGLMRHDFVLGIDNAEDIGRAIQIALATLGEITNVEQAGSLKPNVLIDEFSSSTINLRVFIWTNVREIEQATPAIKSRVMKKVYEAFMHAEIAMPSTVLELKRYEPVDTSAKG